ncbi:hypothetical protein HZS91_00103 [Xanthomonas citri pv. citri]|nr:hypothetical protein CLM98_00945 [Xanthomonas citri pv. citri]QYF33472.1 hypothetical protein HZS91_00103 [Xanthomonas citri pv. citri]
MRAPSSTAWPTKRLISQEEMWGNLRVRFTYPPKHRCHPPAAAATCSHPLRSRFIACPPTHA